MPELLEVEAYRRQAEATVGRTIVRVELFDPAYWRGERRPDELEGATVEGTRRIGKLALLDTDAGTLGLRFGMTGRLLVDGAASIDQLVYTSGRDLPEWHRVAVRFRDGTTMTLTDPRRLGWVELDPDETRLGPDAVSVRPAVLREVLGSSSAPLKARLMDQKHLAGLGNLLTDEILWRAALDPTREARSLTPVEVRRLHRNMSRVIADLGHRGGSHTGDLQAARSPGAQCPRDGRPLRRDSVGGRTTYWCPHHQR